MAQKLLRKAGVKRKVAPKKAVGDAPKRIVLVGTYAARQLEKWPGYYNYPLYGKDRIDVETVKGVNELWLFSGAKLPRYFAAECLGVKTREELKEFGYKPSGKGHGSGKYLLFKIKKLYAPSRDFAESVTIRTKDFAGQGATQKQLKAYLESPDRKDPLLAKMLPKIVTDLPRERLRVCEAAVQLEFCFQPKQLFSIEEVARRIGHSVKIVRRLVASGVLAAERNGSRYFISLRALEEYEASAAMRSTGVLADVHFIAGRGVDPEQREMVRRGKSVGRSRSARILGAESRRRISLKNDAVNWCDITAHWAHPIRSRTMTFVDLFCGAGGLSKGLEMAGLEGICGLDWFDEAGQTYSRNFNHPFINGDIKLPENKQRFYDTVRDRLRGRHLSLVAGGFPCQGFSMAGNRIVDDPRNSLYKELVEIVETLAPDFVLCENVKGLRSMLGGAVEKKILEDFKTIGYDMNVTTLCAADYYVPQKRERVIFVGNRIGVKNLHPRPMLSPQDYVTTATAIGDLMGRPIDPGFNHVPTRHRQDMIDRMRVLPEGRSLYAGYSDAWKRCPWNEASCTIKENHGGVNVHPRLPRVLTAREMARIQSFPDDFIFSGKKAKQLVQIGNAVPPLLGKAVGLAIRVANRDL